MSESTLPAVTDPASLLAAEILDGSFPFTGSSAWMPHGFEIARRLMAAAAAALEALGCEPVILPTLVPIELLRDQAAQIKDFSRRVYFAESAGGDRYVLAPTIEAQASQLFSRWLDDGRRLPFRIHTFRQVARHETGRVAPLWRQRLIWPFCEAQTAFFGDATAEMRSFVRAAETYVRDIAVPILAVRREMSGVSFADYALERWELMTIMPTGEVSNFSSIYHLGDRFSRAFGVVDADGRYPTMVNYGFSSRLLWAMLSLHQRGRWPVHPHLVAPVQVAVIPVTAEDAGQVGHAERLAAELADGDVRTTVLRDPRGPRGFGRSCERARRLGAPVQLHVGAAEVASDSVTLHSVCDIDLPAALPRAAAVACLPDVLRRCSESLLAANRARLAEQVLDIASGASLRDALRAAPNVVVGRCDDRPACAERLRADLAAAEAEAVGYLVDDEPADRACAYCGRRATQRVLCGHKMKGEK